MPSFWIAYVVMASVASGVGWWIGGLTQCVALIIAFAAIAAFAELVKQLA